MTLHRAYSALECKEFDDEKRVIRGLATSPVPDRAGDVVDQYGAQYAETIPLFLYHDSRLTVGTVKLGKPNKNGIPFEAQIPKVLEEGALKQRVDEAWQMVKYKLIAAVSIGFRAIEGKVESIRGGGLKFLASEIVELSLVPVPMQSLATIHSIKSFNAETRKELGIDSEQRASSGNASPESPPDPGVSGQTTKPAKSGPFFARSKGKQMKTIAEQLASFEAKRAADVARMEAIMEKAADEGRSLDESETEEYDTLATEVDGVDKHLERLRKLEKASKAKAAPVAGDSSQAASQSRAGSIIMMERNLPKGTAFTRYAMALAASKGNLMQAHEISKKWRDSTPEVERVLKAAVDAGTTTDTTWAAPLVDYTTLASEFVELLRPQTIIGRLPGLRRVPFNVRMPRQTAGGTYGWVGEGKAKPVGELAFDEITMRWAKAAGIIVITQELARQSNPEAEAIVRQDMIEGIGAFLDQQFTNPSVSEVSNVSPAAITNGVSNTVVAGGTTADAFRVDAGDLWATMLGNNIVPTSGAWLMSNVMAMRLSLMRNALDQREFPELTPTGGTLLGYPVVTSQNVIAPDTDGDMIVFLNQSDIFLSEEGIMLDASSEASLQFNTAPDEPTTASTVLVSLWQRNMIGLRAERYINWKRRRDAAVGYIYAANYGEGS